MIKSFEHKGLEKFFRTGSKSGIQPQHAKRLREQLTVLNTASTPQDVNRHGWGFHPLSYDLEGHWAIRVDRMWRLTFMFEGEDVILLDYQNYHQE